MEAISKFRQLGIGMIGAVDIGGTKIAVGIVDDTGRVQSRLESPTDPDRGYGNAMDRITSMLQEAARSAHCEVTGIGIGCSGPVYPRTGKIGNVNFFPAWEGENPVRDLERCFDVQVAMENDADAAALAEAGWGAGRDKARLIYVTVGTGIGGGVILDGRIYRGVDDSHPEFGHHVIDPSGPPCLCGFHGCWESLAAGPAMVTWTRSAAPTDYPYLRELSAKRICELAVEGDTLARQAVEREAHYLGLGLANLITLFTPNAIVLGGSVMKSASLFLESIRKVIRESCKFVPWERTELSLASLGDNSNLIGAARVWHYNFASEVARCAH
jgi:glucokinase